MMAEHTPGPWKVIDGDSHNGYPEEQSEYEYRVIPESTEPRPNNIIASFWDCEWGYEALANAYLIAAAPDLLAACEAANIAIRETYNGVIIPLRLLSVMNDNEAAIAKARSE